VGLSSLLPNSDHPPRGVQPRYQLRNPGFQMAAPPTQQPGPLLVALHGLGITSVHMAMWTGLAVRGPEAGFATVFPEAWDHGPGRSDGIDDAAFIVALVDQLVSDGIAREGMLVLAGISNGAFFTERLARHGLVQTSAIVLVAGTARESSRRMTLRPPRPTAVLCLVGTGDPLVPYGGGRAAGPLAWMARRRTRRLLLEPDRGAQHLDATGILLRFAQDALTGSS
jgi:poly(3-hydroxybutyrate) depolymerase